MLELTEYTYQEYLNNPPKIDVPYELIAGKIIIMPPESYQNVYIAMQLLLLLSSIFPLERLSNKAEILTGGTKITSRFPDLILFDVEGIKEITEKNTSTINLDMIPPLLVIEIVSPGKQAKIRDYRIKRSEYAARGIRYYWIFDPQKKAATLLELIEGIYETIVYQENGIIHLNNFSNLEINLDKFWN